MSSIIGDLFGGGKQEKSQSTSSSSSSNQAYPFLQGALGGTVNQGAGAGNQIASLLGLNGGPAQNAGFSNWNNSTGYQFGLDQGMHAITGGAATNGLLNSGGTLKSLEQYGQNFANTQYQNYINPLQNLLNSGIGAGGVIGGAGNVSQSQSQSTGSANTQSGGPGLALGQLLAKV